MGRKTDKAAKSLVDEQFAKYGVAEPAAGLSDYFRYTKKGSKR